MSTTGNKKGKEEEKNYSQVISIIYSVKVLAYVHSVSVLHAICFRVRAPAVRAINYVARLVLFVLFALTKVTYFTGLTFYDCAKLVG